jgi:ADP-ribose pyrophosphatase YjhB (NUDIX family)
MTEALALNFCNLCGSKLSLRIPERDDRTRHVCDSCGHVHYQNPRVIVCALPCHEDQVLLCKRAIEPRYGLWTLPGGFMENGESTLDAAIRETMEEAGARIDVHDLYSLYNVIHIDQVQLFFRATLRDLDFAAGTESLEVALFREHEIPWDQLAFPAVASTLRQYFLDLPARKFPLRLADVVLTANNSRIIKAHNFPAP